MDFTDTCGGVGTNQSSITIKINQSMSVTTPAPASAYYGDTFSVAGTATSGLPVTVTGSGSCTGSGTGLTPITMTAGSGTCTVTYSQAGDANFWNIPLSLTNVVTALPPNHIRFAFVASGATCQVSNVLIKMCNNAPGLIGAASTCNPSNGVITITPGTSKGTWNGLTAAPTTTFTGISAGISVQDFAAITESTTFSFSSPSPAAAALPAVSADNPVCVDQTTATRVSCTNALTFNKCNFDAVEVGASTPSNLYTKLAGIPFSFDVVGTGGGASYTGSLKVDLVDASAAGTWACPAAPAATLSTLSITTPATGGSVGSNTSSFTAPRMSYTVNSGTVAAKVVRVRIQDQLSNCYQSTDYFTIRPTELQPTLTAGATNPLIAGKSGDGNATGFTLQAKARYGWSGGTSSGDLTAGYAAAPTVEWATKVTDWTGPLGFVTDYATKITNSLGTTNLAAAAGNPVVAGPTTFFFDDFGPLTFSGINVVDDQTFPATSNDIANSDCTPDYSNTLVGGKYGCYVGSPTLTGTTNRFRPYSYAAQSGLGTPTCVSVSGSFNYVGQNFQGGTLSLTARSASNTPMSRLHGTTLTGNATIGTYVPAYYFVPYNVATAIANYSGASLTPVTGILPLASAGAPKADWYQGKLRNTNGTASADISSSNYSLSKVQSLPATSPFGPYTNFSIGVAVQDVDSVRITTCQDNSSIAGTITNSGTSSTCVPPSGGTANLRFGMLKLDNAYGSELLPLAVPVKALYWDSTTSAWQLNTLESSSCASFTVPAGNNLGIGNYTGTLVAGDTTASPASVTLTGGKGAIVFSAPASGHTGSADVELNLLNTLTTYGPAYSCLTWTGAAPVTTNANKDYLLGNWCGTSYNKNPNARIVFSISKSPFLYQREKY